MEDKVPEGYETFAVTFEKGPLGFTLRRLKDSGRVVVLKVEEKSQASKLNIRVQDEVWAVGPAVLGSTEVDDAVWDNLLQFIKTNRPLTITLLRKVEVQRTRRISFSGISSSGSSLMEAFQKKKSDPVIEPPLPNDIAPQVNTTALASSVTQDSLSSSYSSSPDKDSLSSSLSQEPVVASDEIKALFNRIIIRKNSNKSMGGKKVPISLKEKTSLLLENGVDLLKPDQAIHTTGEVGLLGTFALWNMQKKRVLVLLNDVLLILIPGANNSLEYESTIDLYSLKLRDCVRTGDETNDIISFDLILSGEEDESIRVVCPSEEAKNEWVKALFDRIFLLWGSPDSFAWRHGYVLGSIHAMVVANDIEGVEDLAKRCDAGSLEWILLLLLMS